MVWFYISSLGPTPPRNDGGAKGVGKGDQHDAGKSTISRDRDIGAGFCGLAAGYELSRHGIRVTVLEKDEEIGGLAGSFLINGVAMEELFITTGLQMISISRR